ncbi:MAG: hypothetical protein N2Z79_05265, partial [Candidatus Omnitrophica bacterium]|nr:hypothetical protein [Candidatus Omnitrophota bacterium]
MKHYFIEEERLNEFCKVLTEDYRVFLPVKYVDSKNNLDFYYQELGNSGIDFYFNPYRVREPLKVFFNYPLERVSKYFLAEDYSPEVRKTVVFGVKSCDLFAHKVQDYVFLEGNFIDSIYKKRRENTLLVSSDCIDFKEVCHCLAWDILPYPQEGFDLNLSKLNEGYIVEVGSTEAEGLIKDYPDYFIPAKETQIQAVHIKREDFVKKLKKYIDSLNLVSKESVQRLVREGYNLSTWKEFMLNCVECGGCNLICDTCHCFILEDRKFNSLNEKL